jgi:hypothetical protein
MNRSLISKVLAAAVLGGGITVGAHADWPQAFNGDTNGFDYGNDIKVDANGNVYVLATAEFAGTGLDMALVKYNRFGVVQWMYKWNSDLNANDYAVALAVDASGNSFVTGYTGGEGPSTDFITFKVNATGNILWAKTVDGAFGGDDFPSAIATDSQGNIAVTGVVGTAGFGTDYMTVKYDTTGSELWKRTYSGPGDNSDEARSVAIDGSDNVIVTGRTLNGGNYYDYGTIKYSPTGTQQWVRTYNSVDSSDAAVKVLVDGADNVIVTGTSDGPSFTSDILTVKYSPTGTKQWQTRIGTSNIYETATSLALDEQGNVYGVGTSGTDGEFSDVLSFKLNPSGTKIWSRIFTAKPKNFSGDTGVAIGLDNDLNVFVTAALRENNDEAGTQYGILKYRNSDGVLLNQKRFSLDPVGSAVPSAMAIDVARNRVYVTGFAYNSAGSYFDVFTTKY